MSSTKEYRDFILEQLALVPEVSCRPMMGEFLLYSDGMLFGGIYDDRLLLKIVPETDRFEDVDFKMTEVIPYKGAKAMYLVEEVDDKEKLAEIVGRIVEGLTG